MSGFVAGLSIISFFVFAVWLITVIITKCNKLLPLTGTIGSLLLFAVARVKDDSLTFYTVLLFIIAILLCYQHKKKIISEIKSLIDQCEKCTQAIKDSTSPTDFVATWQNLGDAMNRLKLYRGTLYNKEQNKSIEEAISALSEMTPENYQWFLRNAIDRRKALAIKLIRKDYKDLVQYKDLELQNFRQELQKTQSFFSPETINFANSAVDEVELAVNGGKYVNRASQNDFADYQRSLLTPALRYDILKRDRFRCVICGRTAEDGVKLQVDHILPVSKGGQTTPSNLRTLCQDCNLGKSDKYDANLPN